MPALFLLRENVASFYVLLTAGAVSILALGTSFLAKNPQAAPAPETARVRKAVAEL